jgi:PleD family two-component response regulator
LGRDLQDDEIIDVPVSGELPLHQVYMFDADKPSEDLVEEPDFEKAKGQKAIVLIVEDNTDVRAYIKDYLVSAYQVAEARDGEEGIEKALELYPTSSSATMMPKGWLRSLQSIEV